MMKKKTDAVKENTVAVESETAKIVVDIGGEVVSPMVVELDEGSRVGDAIEAAGGVTENADLTDINRRHSLKTERRYTYRLLRSTEREKMKMRFIGTAGRQGRRPDKYTHRRFRAAAGA